MQNIDIKNLKPYARQLLMLLLASAISLAILLIGVNHYNRVEQKNEQILIRQDELHREIQQLTANQKFLKNTGESFKYIQSLGFFGAEDRLSWAETLKRTAHLLKLPELKYSISPQQQVSGLGEGLAPSLQLSQSVMNIEAGLLHDGDFITLSEQLSLAPGLFRVLGCDLQKENEIALTKPVKNISLKCALAWNTLAYSPEDDVSAEDEFDEAFF
jgi:cell division protein FtsL